MRCFFPRDLLCVSLPVTQRRLRCCASVFVVEIAVWKGGMERYHNRLCLCFVVVFVLLLLWVVQSESYKSQKLSSTPPRFISFPSSLLLLCFTSQEITFFLAFLSPSGLPPQSRGVLWRQCNSLFSQSQLRALWGNLGPSSPPSLFLSPRPHPLPLSDFLLIQIGVVPNKVW